MNKRILNQNGTILPISFLTIFLILTFLSVHIANNLQNFQKLKFRNNAYLCTKSVIYDLDKYYEYISISNRPIKVSYYLQFSPNLPLASAAKIVHNLLKSGQLIMHFSLMKNLGDSRWCNWKNTLKLAITPPVLMRNSLMPKRSKDGQMELRDKWKNQLIFKAKNSLNTIKDSLIIEINLTKKPGLLKDSFTLNSKEISNEALLKSNSLVGSY